MVKFPLCACLMFGYRGVSWSIRESEHMLVWSGLSSEDAANLRHNRHNFEASEWTATSGGHTWGESEVKVKASEAASTVSV